MLLPLQKLDEVDYYTYEQFVKYDYVEHKSVLTVYWRRSWFEFYKPRCQKFGADCYRNGNKLNVDPEIKELSDQLKKWSASSEAKIRQEKKTLIDLFKPNLKKNKKMGLL